MIRPLQQPLSGYLLVAVAALLLYSPILLFGVPYGHDGDNYAGWFLAIREAFSEGTYLPRWLPSMNGGAGSPAFFFYPPLAFYVMAAVDILLGLDRDTLSRLGQGLLPFYVASGLAFLWAARPLLGPKAALFGALAYLAMPYHYGVDLWLRADHAEFAAYAFTPLCVGFCLRLERGWGAAMGLALGVAALILVHVPTALIVTYALGGAVLWWALRHGRPVLLMRFTVSIGIGSALAAFYLVPALAMQDLVQIANLWKEYSQPRFNFLFASSNTHQPYILAALVGESVAIAALLLLLPKEKRKAGPVPQLLAVAALCWLMMLPLSVLLWDYVPFLAKVQFPWRFGGVLDLALAAIAGLSLAWLIPTRRPADLAVLGGVATLFVVANMTPLFSGQVLPLPLIDDPSVREQVAQAVESRRDPTEYRTRWTIAHPGAVPRIGGLPEDGTADVLRWKSRDIALSVHMPTAGRLVVGQYYLPLWQASLDDGTALSTAPTKPEGLLRIAVPEGDHVIALRLAPHPAEIAGARVSLGGAVGFLVLALFAWRRRGAGVPSARSATAQNCRAAS